VQAAGLVGLRFNTIGVSDGISMGTEGMSYSLPSRDLIADSIETVSARSGTTRRHDARLRQEHAGSVMAMLRLNRPAIYGLRRARSSRLRAGQAARRHLRVPVVRRVSRRRSSPTSSGSTSSMHACPGAGACGGMYTANTMATAIEALWACRCRTARRRRRRTQERSTNAAARARPFASLLEQDLKPRDIVTKKSFENALVLVMAVGGRPTRCCI
jgi:dihydroxy-acid dehydratase